MRSLNAQHAVMFRRIASNADRIELEEGQQGLLGGWITRVSPCLTGLEYNTVEDRMEPPDCIDSVFAMVKQDKLPRPDELGYFIAYNFMNMHQNDDPWIKRFAFVLSAGTAMIRKVCGI